MLLTAALLWGAALTGLGRVEPCPAQTSGPSAANGIYGGYVGSDRWFAEMRRSAANQAMMEALAGTRGSRRLPAGYIELAGRIVFPEGNPFPKGRLPDLRITCRDREADSVERAPFLDEDGGFYTVLRRGQTYDFLWMYYFGSRERFASLEVPEKGPAPLKLAIEYRPEAATEGPGAGPSGGQSRAEESR